MGWYLGTESGHKARGALSAAGHHGRAEEQLWRRCATRRVSHGPQPPRGSVP